METNVPVIAGAISTTTFALSTPPMLFKAFHTSSLTSNSLGNTLPANMGNVVHRVSVFGLPAEQIWLLHSFYPITTGLIPVCYRRYECRPDGKSLVLGEQ